MIWPQINHPEAFTRIGLLSRAVYTRLDLGDSWRIRQGEATVTDTLLLDIAISRLPGVGVRKVSVTQESRGGMDWLLAVPVTGGWAVLALQAKRLKDGQYNFRHVVKSTNRDQLDLLDEFCRSRGAIGGYTLYNAPSHVTKSQWHCTEPFDAQCISLMGCTLVPLRVARRALRKVIEPEFAPVHQDSDAIPLRCLFHRHLGTPNGMALSQTQAASNTFEVYPELPFGLEAALSASPYPAELDRTQFPGGRLPKWIGVVGGT